MNASTIPRENFGRNISCLILMVRFGESTNGSIKISIEMLVSIKIASLHESRINRVKIVFRVHVWQQVHFKKAAT